MAVPVYTGRIRTGVTRAVGAGVGPVGRSVRNFLRLALATTAGRIGLPIVALYLMLALIGPWLAPYSATGFHYDEAGKVQRANLDGSGVVDLAANLLSEPKYMALDVAGGKMYWTDSSTSKVQRADLDGSAVEDLVTGLGSPEGIALDVAGGKMYWVDSGADKVTDSGIVEVTDKVQRANLDGSAVEDLVTSGLALPRGIALDVAGGKMYWTDSATSKVQRANLDGSAVEDLVTPLDCRRGLADPLCRPAGMALDVAGGKMYWTDSAISKVQRANLDGSAAEDLVTELGSPEGMALDVAGGKMYWVDSGTDKIQWANLDGSAVEDLVTSGLTLPRGIALDVAGGKMYWTDEAGLQQLLGPSWQFWLGTDQFGRDLLSRMMSGARSLIGMAVAGAALGIALGTVVGMSGGYKGGRVDQVVMRVMDGLMSFPSLLLALLVLTTLGARAAPVEWLEPIWQELLIMVTIAVVFMPFVARVMRSVTLSLKEKEFVLSARLRGEPAVYIIFREILPNALPVLGVEASVRLSYAILLVSSLGFLGLGVQPPSPDWGLMISDSRGFLVAVPRLALVPAAAIASLVVGVNLLADGIRQATGLPREQVVS